MSRDGVTVDEDRRKSDWGNRLPVRDKRRLGIKIRYPGLGSFTYLFRTKGVETSDTVLSHSRVSLSLSETV